MVKIRVKHQAPLMKGMNTTIAQLETATTGTGKTSKQSLLDVHCGYRQWDSPLSMPIHRAALLRSSDATELPTEMSASRR